MDVLKSAWSKIQTDQMEENRDKALRTERKGAERNAKSKNFTRYY
jgi:hypothetical protein